MFAPFAPVEDLAALKSAVDSGVPNSASDGSACASSPYMYGAIGDGNVSSVASLAVHTTCKQCAVNTFSNQTN